MGFEWFEKLGVMGWPLAVCSVLALAVIFERGIFMYKASKSREETYGALSKLLLQHRDKPKPVRDELVALNLSEYQQGFKGGSNLLRTIGTISPILGLLGTVIGIIGAFQKIAASTGAVNPAMIADGLWEALLTTAVGLSIALPCLLASQGFKVWSDRILSALCLRLNRLSLSFELEGSDESSVSAFSNRRAA